MVTMEVVYLAFWLINWTRSTEDRSHISIIKLSPVAVDGVNRLFNQKGETIFSSA